LHSTDTRIYDGCSLHDRNAAADKKQQMNSIVTILLTITSVGISLVLAQAALVGVLRLARFDAQRRR